MSDTKQAPATVHPAIMDAIYKQDSLGRISIESLAVGDVIEVKTLNSTYSLRLTEMSDKHHVLAVESSNKKYPGDYKKGVLVGTTIGPGSSIISPRMFAVGGQMEICLIGEDHKTKVMATSTVSTVSINGVKVLPVSSVES